jgi:nucleotide-binding universal stress UspA family protein
MSDAAAGPRRILVPVDFSDASAHALRLAVALGDVFVSTVDALHVWHTNTETPVHVARERARAELRSFIASLGPSGGATLRRCIDHGDPFLTILRVAQLSSYDLLVGSAPHPGGGTREELGLALLRAARLPVLLVPSAWVEAHKQPELKRHVRRILLPAAHAGRAPRAGRCALELAVALDATLELAFVTDPRVSPEQERCEAELTKDASFSSRVERRRLEGSLEVALGRRAEEGGYDFVVLADARGTVDQSTADPMLARLVSFQRCPTLCERWD